MAGQTSKSEAGIRKAGKRAFGAHSEPTSGFRKNGKDIEKSVLRHLLLTLNNMLATSRFIPFQ